MCPKQSQGLFPALRSSPQELKSSRTTEVTEAVETVLKWSKMGFSTTGTSRPPYLWVQYHPRLMTPIIAAEFKTRRRWWDYYGSNWTCEHLRLLLLCCCLSGRLVNGGCNSCSNLAHQRSFGPKPYQTGPNWNSLQLLSDQSETSEEVIDSF